MRCKDTNKRGQKQTQFVFCRAGVSWAQPKRMNKRGQKQTQFAFCRAGVSWAEPKRMNKRRFGLPAFAESSRKADATSQTSAGRSFAARRPACCVPPQAAPRAMCIPELSQQNQPHGEVGSPQPPPRRRAASRRRSAQASPRGCGLGGSQGPFDERPQRAARSLRPRQRKSRRSYFSSTSESTRSPGFGLRILYGTKYEKMSSRVSCMIFSFFSSSVIVFQRTYFFRFRS